MRISITRSTSPEAGYALALAIVFAGVSLIILASTLSWTSSGVRVTGRNNAYSRAVSAAEASVESVVARMDRDFLNRSLEKNLLLNDLSAYRQTTAATYLTNDWPQEYLFTDTNGAPFRTTVIVGAGNYAQNVDPDLPGLWGTTLPCRIASYAKHTGTGVYDVPAGVQQDFQFLDIPIFQFQSFYALDMEINPSPPMKINGKVHGNADMYLAPVQRLEFVDIVETHGQVYLHRMTNDPNFGSAKVNPIFDIRTDNPKSGVDSLTLPIGTNNSPSEIVKILDAPPPGEDPLSPLGAARYYNQVDLTIKTWVSNGIETVTVNGGRWDVGIPPVQGDITNSVTPGNPYSFIDITQQFYDGREGKTVKVTEFSVAKFNNFISNTIPGKFINNLKMLYKNNQQLNSVYIDDQRPGSSGVLRAIRVVEGVLLPTDGLTVATPRPLYVEGYFNAPTLTVGSTDTSKTRPASLVGDAISVLSTSWTDSANTSALGNNHTAGNTTVNAAFLAGIVPTTVGHYSGGLENFPRFLENWGGGATLTYNGSMVVMFPSRYATGYWGSSSYYTPPNRAWAFDLNFLQFGKLPPCTPSVRKLKRGQWTTIAAAVP